MLWLDAANNALNNPSAKHNATDVPIRKQRKKRTIIGKTAVAALDEAFRLDSKPTNQEMGALADKLSLEKDVVRVWFGNREHELEPDG
ncbi:Protein nubbin [Orchesella cincta]|uniref:Protein nubbin n=1 Tax=Orchesella cincta TaxID=48709 RepID=A0A1D2MDT2_ORCCI|nr:Protein nubbin [Orchesella cincta]